MAKSIQINSVAEAQQQFRQLQDNAKNNPALQNWSDKLSLEPFLDSGLVMLAVGDDAGGVKNYQLWMHNGKVTAFAHENVAKIYESEVLDGVVRAISSRVNPITGAELNQIPKGEKPGPGRQKETIWGYDDPRVEVLQSQASKITSALHETTDMKPSMVVAMPRSVFDAIPANVMQKNIEAAPIAPTVRPPAARAAPQIEMMPPPVKPKSIDPPPPIPLQAPPPAWGPTVAGVSEDKVKTMMPPDKVGAPTEFITAYSAASAALQQMKMTYWERMPESERMSKPQIEKVVAAHEKAYPEFGKILRDSYAEMESLKKDNIMERVNGPVRIFNKGIAELSKSYNAHVHEFQQKPEIPKVPPGAPPQAPRTQLDTDFTTAMNLLSRAGGAGSGITPKEMDEGIAKLKETNPNFADIVERHKQDMQGGLKELMKAYTEEKLKKIMPAPQDKNPALQAMEMDEGLASRMYAAAQTPREEPLPETFARAHDNRLKEPELVAVADVSPQINNPGTKFVV